MSASGPAIPVKAFAVAADFAARHCGSKVADVFDEGPSRARIVACAALIEIYPGATQVAIARCFGWTGSGREFSDALMRARCSAWWRLGVDKTIAETRAVLAQLPATALHKGDEPVERLPARVEKEAPAPRAAIYRKRRFLPVLKEAPARIVTSALLGDPPAGRREYLASLESADYSARIEGRVR